MRYADASDFSTLPLPYPTSDLIADFIPAVPSASCTPCIPPSLSTTSIYSESQIMRGMRKVSAKYLRAFCDALKNQSVLRISL